MTDAVCTLRVALYETLLSKVAFERKLSSVNVPNNLVNKLLRIRHCCVPYIIAV